MHIKELDEDFYRNEDFQLFRIKGIRNRLVHNYDTIDYMIIRNIITNVLPTVKNNIELLVGADLLNNPYILYNSTVIEQQNKSVEDDEGAIDRVNVYTNNRTGRKL